MCLTWLTLCPHGHCSVSTCPLLIHWLRSPTALPHEIIVTESDIAFLQCLLVQHNTVCFQGGRGGGKVYFWGLPRESFM